VKAAAALLLVLALAGCGGSAPVAPEPPKTLLDAIASEIAERPVGVRCDGRELPDFGPNAAVHGVVWFRNGKPDDHTTISPTLCRELERVRAGLPAADAECLASWAGLGCGDRVARAALALATLAHEAWHLAGIQDEPTADCYAIQTVELVGLRLGLPPDQASGLAAFAKANHRVGQGATYASSQCSEGGALDLRPAHEDGL
jgi:hypothetical protein